MNRTASALALILLQAFSLSAQNGKNAPPEIPPAFDLDTTIRVEVSRVPLLFTVTDKKNRFITNLDREDFRVFDNKKEQDIREFVRESDLPLRIGIVLDSSNSIRDRFRFEQEAAIEFIRGVLREERDRAFLVSFDTRAELIVDFTNDPEELAKGVRRLRAGGGTALYDAIYYSCRDKLPEDWPPEQFSAGLDCDRRRRGQPEQRDARDGRSRWLTRPSPSSSRFRRIAAVSGKTEIKSCEPSPRKRAVWRSIRFRRRILSSPSLTSPTSYGISTLSCIHQRTSSPTAASTRWRSKPA